MKRKQTLKSVCGDTVLRAMMLMLILICVFPFVYMFIISLMNTNTMKLSWDRLLTAEWTIENYINLFTGTGKFHRYIWNTAVMTIYAVVVTCLVSSMAAYAFAKKRFLGRDKIYYVYLMTMMIPSQVLLIPTFLIVKQLHLLNTYTAMALPTINAFGVVLVYSFMKNLPDDLLEAADLDGCSEARKFVSIVLPLIKPVMISLAIFTFINVWGSLLWPLVVADGDMTTVTQGIASMKNAMKVTNYGYMMAGTACAFLPPFLLYVFLQKQFVEGIALSGTKA